ncbi:hypothetical protein [Streptomyces sp. NPDC056543]|uniref:hypothetical protein n=1 Tax=unclassified Streptomyces TaxID=2593676 RepID=UPI0036D1996D
MAFGRRKNETSSETVEERAARLPKTMPSWDARRATPDNPHSNQYSAISGGYTNREKKPVPGTPKKG